MNHDPNTLCYLCGKPLGNQKVNEDHVVQKLFMKRSQPKAKGFDYAGVLLTHEDCNNKFGGSGGRAETMCKKALQLLNALSSDKTLFCERKDNPNIRIVAIPFDQLPLFADDDKKFFGLIDVRNEPYEKLTSAAFLTGKEKINPFKSPVNVALSVLAKSAAAVLVKRGKISPSSQWRILAMPFYSGNADFDLDHIFGHTKPFEIGVKLWAKPFENQDWFVAYKHEGLLLFFCLGFSQDESNFRKLANRFKDATKLVFESHRLIDLVGYDWSDNNFESRCA